MSAASLSVPHFEQEFRYSCVAACVRMVLAFHGHVRTEDELRQLMGTGPHGTLARDILRLTGQGFHVQLGRSNRAELAAALANGIPPIVFVETTYLSYWTLRCDHVTVVVGLDATTAYLNDPFFPIAPQQVALPAFLQAWASNDCWAAYIRPQPGGP